MMELAPALNKLGNTRRVAVFAEWALIDGLEQTSYISP